MKITEVLKTNFPQLTSSTSLLEEIEKIGLLQNFDKDTIVLKENSGE